MKTRLMLAISVVLLAPWAQAQDAPPAGVHYITLIRHGMYDAERDVDNRVRNGLNELGKEQARLAGERLARYPVKIHALVTSDFRRAKETAEIIGRALQMTPVVDSLIHECTPNSDRPDYMKDHAPGEIALCDSNLTAAWSRYIVPTPGADTHDVLVCHGNVIRWFVARTLKLESTHWTGMDIGNASLTVISVRADGATRLVSFSDVGHIPVEKQTWTGRGAGLGPRPAERPVAVPPR